MKARNELKASHGNNALQFFSYLCYVWCFGTYYVFHFSGLKLRLYILKVVPNLYRQRKNVIKIRNKCNLHLVLTLTFPWRHKIWIKSTDTDQFRWPKRTDDLDRQAVATNNDYKNACLSQAGFQRKLALIKSNLTSFVYRTLRSKTRSTTYFQSFLLMILSALHSNVLKPLTQMLSVACRIFSGDDKYLLWKGKIFRLMKIYLKSRKKMCLARGRIRWYL